MNSVVEPTDLSEKDFVSKNFYKMPDVKLFITRILGTLIIEIYLLI